MDSLLIKLFCLSCLYTLCWTYHLVIHQKLPHGATVVKFLRSDFFERDYTASLHQSLEYSKGLPFEIDRRKGSLVYKPNGSFLLRNHNIKDSYSFSLKLRSLSYHTIVTIPFEIDIISADAWVKYTHFHFYDVVIPRSSKEGHHSVLIQTIARESNVFDLLRVKHCPYAVLLETLCSCQVINEQKLLNDRVSHITQNIKNCNISDIYIPTQSVTVKIRNRQLQTQRRKDTILRRRRRSHSSLHFEKSSFTATIQENLPANFLVETMRVFDARGRQASGVTYKLYAVENRRSLERFKIDKYSGEVRTTMQLDREKFPKHKIGVTAAHGSQAQCILNINVLDVNDHAPKFEELNGYNVSVNENEVKDTTVITLKAQDEDSGNNGRIRYYIYKSVPPSGRQAFTISNNGILLVNSKIDREEQDRYTLTIVAADYGQPSLSSSVTVVVDVEDQNDNTPQFTKSQYVANVSEDVAVGDKVTAVEAIDGDEGSNGEVTYSLIRGNNKFSVDSKTGNITVRSKLDYEVAREESGAVYTLRIRASDGGGRLNSSGVVRINILDVNDHSPQFFSSPYYFAIGEDAHVNTRVGQVEASDQDHGKNAYITYSILPNGRPRSQLPFQVERTSGVIKVFKPLDHEKVSEYKFTIRASDNGQPRRSVVAEVTVTVKDVNDNAPHFNASQYNARIPEDKQIGSEIVTVAAEDPDKELTIGITFSIVGGDPDRKFSITTRGGTGVIKLHKRLDYSKEQTYKLKVNASDGTLSNTTSVTIVITDTNSYSPVFDSISYTVSVPENVTVGTIIETVHASDNDDGDNARITYCFSPPTRDFTINKETGAIKIAEPLDYETQKLVSLVVLARDNGIPQKEDLTELIIYVQDANDNAPVFDSPQYTGEVYENEEVDIPVHQIHATDRDSGTNKQIHYTFDNGNNGNGDFSIDSRTGTIRTARVLDRESISSYHLIAYAVDGGRPALSTSVSIVVNVLDVDDNPPVFADDTLVFTVREDVPLTHVIAKIRANDPDLSSNSPNSRITYDLGQDAHDLRNWILDERTGDLKSLHKLDYETKQNYTLTVSATSNELVNHATVIILVEDCNDNWPVINPFEIVFNNYRTKMGDSFPTGIIGKVPAYDPDVSDKLTYRFQSGNSGNLLLLNRSSGDLYLNSSLDSNRQFTTTMMVEVYDGLHRLSAPCTLKVTGITDEMLQHSITVRVLHMNAYTFLSPIMYQFVDGLAHILNVTSNNIYVFNVQNDTDVQQEVLNVSFSARRDRSDFFTSKYLQNQVYLNRQELAELTKKTVLPFDDNICLREPCQNYKRCTSVLTFDSSASFVSSRQMIFRPIYPVYKLKCECPIGFTNDETCSDEVDMCYSKPCLNGGRCQAKEGGYTCVCKDGYEGDNCEVDLTRGQCDVHQSACRNGGICRDIEPHHFSCDCSSLVPKPLLTEVSPYCKLLSRHFEPGNFLMLPGITNQWHFTLSISFSTLEENGLIFYNGRLNHEHDFMALELVNGQAQLNFSTGQSSTLVDPFIEGGLNDGRWHTVELQYYNEPKSEPLARGMLDRAGPSSSKIVILTVDPLTCDHVVASNWNTAYGVYTCSKKVKQTSTKNSLDLTSPLLLGGVPDLPEDYQVKTKSYSGCLRDLYVDGRQVDLGQFIARNGSTPGCPPMWSQCSSMPCYNNATKCESRFNHFKCFCADGFTGRRCEHQSNFVGQIRGTGCLSYDGVADIKSFRPPWHEDISFRTYDDNSVLLYFVIGTDRTIKVTTQIKAGHILYEVQTLTTIQHVSLPRTSVNDGEWHDLAVDWTYSSSSRVRVTLNLDQESETSYIEFPSSSIYRNKLSTLHIGGKVTSGHRTQLPFNGCLQNIQIGPTSQKHRISKNRLVFVGGATFTDGCSAPRACLSNPCPFNSKCEDKWASYTCRCNEGYVGKNCDSICSLNVCENNSTCLVAPKTERGYRCFCSSGWTGDTCGKPYTETCPSGWYGTGICAPCNCSAEKNFDPTCDSLTGECFCSKNYYYVESTQSCKPCKCYHLGSKGLGCSDETGQCTCKDTVIGRQCNLCSSAFAEITSSGCTVLYDRCPRSSYEGITWDRTDFNERLPAKCPGQAEGYAIRTCDSSLGWLQPDYGNCTSKAYHRLAAEVDKIEGGTSPLTTKRSTQLAFNLDLATSSTTILYQNDVTFAYLLIRDLLEFESEQGEFGLSASHDYKFTDNLAQASSSILNDDVLHFWRKDGNQTRRRRSSGMERSLSAPLLVDSWERYTTTFLQNFNQIYYDSCIVQSPNMNVMLRAVKLGSISEEGFSYTNILHSNNDESNVLVVLPQYLFGNEWQVNSTVAEPAAVGIIAFRNIEKIFPESFADDRTFRRPRKPSVNSVVVSVQTYSRLDGNTDGMAHKLKSQPVVLHFRLLNTKAIEPICVFWNFTAKSSGSTVGGWSHTGCRRETYNLTHVECHCYHLATFAVITDEEIPSVAAELSVLVVMILGVSVSTLLLVVTAFASVALPHVTSVRAVVNRNSCFAIIAANLVFVLGIQQTSNIYWCMAVAVGLHFLLLTTFSWIFIDGLHLYRKLTERRDVNRGHTRVYYIVGWILPAIVTALSVGLDAKGYGNTSFCWISMDDVLIWSFAGPVVVCCLAYVLLFIMSIHAFLSSKRVDMKRKELSYEMRSSFFISPTIMCTWAFATLAVNFNVGMYFYLFALTNALQGILIFLFHCFFNKEIRNGYKRYKQKVARKQKLNTTAQHLLQSSMGATPDSSARGGLQRFDHSTSESITMRTLQDSPMLPPRSDSESDSYDSDSSDSSMSLDSTSEDNQVEINTYRNIRNTRPDYQPKQNNHVPTTKHKGNGRLPNGSNGNSRVDQLSVKKKLVIRDHADGSLSDGSNETSV